MSLALTAIVIRLIVVVVFALAAAAVLVAFTGRHSRRRLACAAAFALVAGVLFAEGLKMSARYDRDKVRFAVDCVALGGIPLGDPPTCDHQP